MWRILWVLMVAEVVSGFETSMVLAGLPAWLRLYGDPIGVGWIVTSYLLVAASAAALCGRLGDLYGRKRVLLVVLGAAAIGSAISAAGPSLGWIIAGRSLQGLAGGAIIPLCYGLTKEHIASEKVATAIGFIVATASAATGSGVLAGGILTDRLGPQSIFTFSAAIAALTFAIVWLMLPASPVERRERRIDWLGGLLFAPGIAALLVVASQGKDWGWTAPATLALAAGGAIVLALWVWHELRQDDPLIDVRLFADRRCALANLVMASAGLGVMQLTQLNSLLLQQSPATGVGLGTSATFVGLLKFPALAAGIVGSLVAGWACGRFGGRAPMAIGCVLMTVATALGALSHDSVAIVITVIVIGMFGVTAAYTAVPAVIVAASPPNRTSEATGMMAVIRSLTQAIGAQVLTVLLAYSAVRGPDGRPAPTDSGYTAVFWFMALVSALGIGFSLALGGRPRRAPAAVPVGAAAITPPA
jgi:MFS family permease